MPRVAPRELERTTTGASPAPSTVYETAAAQATREARDTGRPLREVLAGRTDVDVDTLLPASSDTGEAGVQVDAVLADHRRLTEGTG